MNKSITTLASDIYHILGDGSDLVPSEKNLIQLGENMGGHIVSSLSTRSSSRELGKLWFSELGEKCVRKLWYKFNKPEAAESMPGSAYFKFLYGDIIEEQVLLLAKEAGHDVSKEQARVEYHHEDSGWQITGRVDAVIDGALVDVKSCSSYAYKSYQYGINETNDSFGYRFQLSGYFRYGDFKAKDSGIVWVDKQNGFINYTMVEPIQRDVLDNKIGWVARSIENETEPARGHLTVPEGKSGNETLSIPCSYCSFKQECWKDANQGQGLKGYRYSTGPKWLVKVVKEPRVDPIAI